jgi:DNA replication regulator DPB11
MQTTHFPRREPGPQLLPSLHLLCPSGTGAKFEKAKEWGVPVVGMEWLEGVIRTGEVVEVERYLIGCGGGSEGGMEVVGVGGEMDVDMEGVRGKGKEKVDAKMVDITNSKYILSSDWV